jgi:uncharacterized phiE125 gp8 family phage protein
VRETVRPSGAWQRLSATPVRGITAALAVRSASADAPLSAAGFSVDIDAEGQGWIRIVDAAGAERVRVVYQAGLASDWSGAPAPLRHGVIRLAAHLYALRSAPEQAGARLEPPAGVSALWRPYRRVRLG